MTPAEAKRQQILHDIEDPGLIARLLEEARAETLAAAASAASSSSGPAQIYAKRRAAKKREEKYRQRIFNRIAYKKARKQQASTSRSTTSDAVRRKRGEHSTKDKTRLNASLKKAPVTPIRGQSMPPWRLRTKLTGVKSDSMLAARQ